MSCISEYLGGEVEILADESFCAFVDNLWKFYGYYGYTYLYFSIAPLVLLFFQAFSLGEADDLNLNLCSFVIFTTMPLVLWEAIPLCSSPKKYFNWKTNKTNYLDLITIFCYLLNSFVMISDNSRSTGTVSVYCISIFISFCKLYNDLRI